MDNDFNKYNEVAEMLKILAHPVRLCIVKGLLENRARYEEKAKELGEEELFKQEPKAQGYLRPCEGYRLFEKRTGICARLTADVRDNKEWLLDTLQYPLAGK